MILFKPKHGDEHVQKEDICEQHISHLEYQGYHFPRRTAPAPLPLIILFGTSLPDYTKIQFSNRFFNGLEQINQELTSDFLQEQLPEHLPVGVVEDTLEYFGPAALVRVHDSLEGHSVRDEKDEQNEQKKSQILDLKRSYTETY